MIPKIIHYCWFGDKPFPKLGYKCLESWKKYLPDYETKDFYELEIASAGIMRGFLSIPCDMYFTMDRKVKRFIETTYKIYEVPNEKIVEVINFVNQFNFKEIATEVINSLFKYLKDRT